MIPSDTNTHLTSVDEDEDVDIDGIGSDDPMPPDLVGECDRINNQCSQEPNDDDDGQYSPFGQGCNFSDDLVNGVNDYQVGFGLDNKLLSPKLDSCGNAMMSTIDCTKSAKHNLSLTSEHSPLNGASIKNEQEEGINGDISSLTIPSMLTGSNPDSLTGTTAFAQVTKIEQGIDGKGYVLHLNIPALGLSNVILSTPGLSLAPGTDQKLLAAGASTILPTLLNMSDSSMLSPQSLPPDDAPLESGECMALRRGDSLSDESLGGHTPEESTGFHDIDSGQDNSPQSCISSINDACGNHGDLALDDNDAQLLDMEQLATVEGSSSSSDSGCALGSAMDLLEDSYGGINLHRSELTLPAVISETRHVTVPSEVSVAEWVEGQSVPKGENSPKSEYVEVAQWVEKPEVERFVICSDGPMECVLCAFKTVDYSAFKSHIICSHPCWRITKKLSKNRLLVEKSVKMNVNLAPVNQSATKPRKNTSAKDRELNKSDNSHTSGVKTKKGQHMYQRKKQMLERNKRQFRCSLCMRLFVFEGSIVNHLVDHHLVKKPYDYIQVSNDHGKTFGQIHRCSYKNCYTSCVTEEELERHRIESHAQVIYRCQICGYTAESSDAVERHASSMHSQYDLMYGLVD